MFFNSAAFKLGKLPRYDSHKFCPTVTLLDADAAAPLAHIALNKGQPFFTGFGHTAMGAGKARVCSSVSADCITTGSLS